MTSIGQAPHAGAISSLYVVPATGRFLISATAVSLLLLGSAGAASAAPWTMTFEDEVTVGDGLVDHGELVGNKWRTVSIPGSQAGIKVMISAYGRSSTGLPSGGIAGLPSFTTGTGAKSNDNRRAMVFDTNQTSTSTSENAEQELRVYNSTTSPTKTAAQNKTADNRTHFKYGAGSEAKPAGIDSNTKYKPGNVLILDDARTSGETCSNGICTKPDTYGDDGSDHNDDGGLFVFQFSAPVTLSSIDFFDTQFGVHEYQKISFYNAAGTEIYVTAGSVNIADSLVTEGSGKSAVQQLYVPNTGDGKWRRLTFNVANVTTMTIGCKTECAIDNIKGAKTPHGPGGHNVPEPGALALLGLGLIGMVAIRRRTI